MQKNVWMIISIILIVAIIGVGFYVVMDMNQGGTSITTPLQQRVQAPSTDNCSGNPDCYCLGPDPVDVTNLDTGETRYNIHPCGIFPDGPPAI